MSKPERTQEELLAYLKERRVWAELYFVPHVRQAWVDIQIKAARENSDD